MGSNSYDKVLEQLKEYCDYYNIPLKHITTIMSDVKVIPMIRGKGFEFIISDVLKTILSKDKWEVSNPNINAQSEIHDVDVYVTRIKDRKQVRIECKLSKKDSFRINDNNPTISVKCMRSRTLSDNEMATRMARRYGVDRQQVLAHADNYREGDFDFVVTSLGNAFWDTKEGKYVFAGAAEQLKILAELFPDRFSEKDSADDFKEKTFAFLLFAHSKNLSVKKENNLKCTRRKCIQSGNSEHCGFIPNYPLIYLNNLSKDKDNWKPISEIERALDAFLDKRS